MVPSPKLRFTAGCKKKKREKQKKGQETVQWEIKNQQTIWCNVVFGQNAGNRNGLKPIKVGIRLSLMCQKLVYRQENHFVKFNRNFPINWFPHNKDISTYSNVPLPPIMYGTWWLSVVNRKTFITSTAPLLQSTWFKMAATITQSSSLANVRVSV